jgi:dimethylglycine dehydrogenase
LADNAVMGESYGLEYPLWFAPKGEEAKDVFSFRRSTDFPHVGAEVNRVRTAVGVMETSGYAKYKITGSGAESWLSHTLANKIPVIGRMVLTPMLNQNGKLIGDFTLAKLDQDQFLIIGSGPAEHYHMRWFEQNLPKSGVQIEALGLDLVGLSIAGPKSRDLLAKITVSDVSNAAFPFMSIRKMDLGSVPAIVGRVTFTGDLGYEIWVKPEFQRALLNLLLEKGEEFGIGHFGLRALNSMRLEKNFGTWAREYRPIYGPLEAGLGRFADLKKNSFIGREAAAEEKSTGGALRLVSVIVDATDSDCIGDEPIWHNGKVVGWVTSGGYGHWVKKSIAMGYIPKELADESTGFEIEVIGERRTATLIREPLFDPKGEKMRG